MTNAWKCGKIIEHSSGGQRSQDELKEKMAAWKLNNEKQEDPWKLL